MKALWESAEFQAELPGWALRGTLCATSSVGWAWLIGFQSSSEFAGMAAGVACWVAVFAGICAWVTPAVPGSQLEWVIALKWAAWIKVALTASAWLCYAGASAVGLNDLSQMAMLGTVDLLLGMASLWVVALAAGLPDPGHVATADSFGLTTLTTLTEGMLMALLIAGLAVAVWIGRRMLVASASCWKFFPVRNAD